MFSSGVAAPKPELSERDRKLCFEVSVSASYSSTEFGGTEMLVFSGVVEKLYHREEREIRPDTANGFLLLRNPLRGVQ